MLGLLARRFGVCLHQPNACQDPARPLQTKPPPAPLQEFWSQGLDPSNQPALPRRWKHRNLLRSALSLRNKTARSSQTAPKHLALPGCASPARESPRHSAGVLRGPWVWGHNGREQGSRAAPGPWGHSTSASWCQVSRAPSVTPCPFWAPHAVPAATPEEGTFPCHPSRCHTALEGPSPAPFRTRHVLGGLQRLCRQPQPSAAAPSGISSLSSCPRIPG